MEKFWTFLGKVWTFLKKVIAAIIAAVKWIVRHVKKLTVVGKTEFLIPVIAFIIWLLFAAGGWMFGWTTYPVGYFQKLVFGIFGMSLISGVAWIWLGATFSHLKQVLDPDSIDYKMLDTWQKIKLAFWFFAWYSGGTVFLASLY